MIERLESRLLRAAQSVSQTGGTLTVNGSGGTDTINVVENHGAVHVELNSAASDYAGVSAIKINAGGGNNDTVFFTGNSIGANIDGSGSNNDTISIDDQGTGSSYATGGGGADTLVVQHSNNTTVVGGGGADQFDLNTSNVATLQGNNSVVYAYGVHGGTDVFVDYAQQTYINGSSTAVVQASGTGIAYIFDDKHDTIIYAA